ncbi:MAG: hypothetical protein U5K81_04185 [Trueperaceae bacterium]|nr:hypothetical protein [Trueperaceae bacterium]
MDSGGERHTKRHTNPQLGIWQRSLLIFAYEKEQKFFAAWESEDSIPVAGGRTGDNASEHVRALPTKPPRPPRTVAWLEARRAINHERERKIDTRLADAVDQLEERGFVDVAPPRRPGRKRRRRHYQLTDQGRGRAAMLVNHKASREAGVPGDVGGQRYKSDLVWPHYLQWKTKRDELERGLHDTLRMTRMTEQELAEELRALIRARVLQEYAKRTLPEIESAHSEPAPHGMGTATLTIMFSVAEAGSVDKYTVDIMSAMVSDVASKANAKKKQAEQRRAPIHKNPLEEDVD